MGQGALFHRYRGLHVQICDSSKCLPCRALPQYRLPISLQRSLRAQPCPRQLHNVVHMCDPAAILDDAVPGKDLATVFVSTLDAIYMRGYDWVILMGHVLRDNLETKHALLLFPTTITTPS